MWELEFLFSCVGNSLLHYVPLTGGILGKRMESADTPFPAWNAGVLHIVHHVGSAAPVWLAFVDARVQPIYGGTNEIMKELIARPIVSQNGVVVFW
ncbi:hypothetical protein NFI96_006138 [Prochilodus magdalenae]|nr:hypothetical protein NFI96_006138 [Prochilodus magdalenae]